MVGLVFIDTETTSLRPDRRVWEVALIARTPDGDDEEYAWYVEAASLDLGNADPFALKVGHFYERHPTYAPETFAARTTLHDGGGLGVKAVSSRSRAIGEREVLVQVEEITRGAHLVGAVPNFDADVLGARMRAHGILPSWHYHLIDVEPLMVGYLRGQNDFRQPSSLTAIGVAEVISLPWKSDALSIAVGVQPPGEDQRHTALGDARWARDIYDAVMSRVPALSGEETTE